MCVQPIYVVAKQKQFGGIQFSGPRSPLLILVSYMYINYVDCVTAVARTNKVNTNAFDASGIFRDVDISMLCKLC